MTVLSIPEFSLVVLIGASGSGKSTFATRHFKPTEVISSDYCRGLVADDENDQSATNDAFAVLHFIVARRLANRRLTVVDATNVKPEDRRHLVKIAREHHALPVAIVINPGESICHERNASRPNRQFGPHVVRHQTRAMKRGLRGLGKEGFRRSFELRSAEEVEAVTVERHKLWTDKTDQTGPFDIIGDVHGCYDELVSLLDVLGYSVSVEGDSADRTFAVTAPQGRIAVFVGDLVDRGPNTPDVMRLVMSMVNAGQAHCVLGNHDAKLLKWLNGRKVQMNHGLAESVEQMASEPEEFHKEIKSFINGLVSHYMLDGGALAIAHAGIREDMQGRASGAIRTFCLYGETTGENDEFGLPVRYNWAGDYRGQAMVVYGHTPIPEPEWLNNTICIDTGCVFGGTLTALRYPEGKLVSVPANQVYAEPIRPLVPAAGTDDARTAQQQYDDVLDFADVSGKRILSTALHRTVVVQEANSAAAIEVMSRFAVNPKWLIYLPPTMSPSATSNAPGLLEHPADAFGYFTEQGVENVVCEEKHMGSRAVIVLCRSVAVATTRFGVDTDETGAIYSRTGRTFFQTRKETENILQRLRDAMDRAGLWDRLETDWICLDAEIMPWSAKAQSLIQQQYAPAASAARIALAASVDALHMAEARGLDLADLVPHFETRADKAIKYADAYRGYCWDVSSIEDLRIAPFHILATETGIHMDKDHLWHMSTLAELASPGDPVLIATPHRLVELNDEVQVSEAIDWWTSLTGQGGEGMVVKPRDFIVQGERGLVQPALKCRGLEYLRIIYGPEYDHPDNLNRLRRRGLGKKRSLAQREFALGHEALTRFVAHKPLRRVHECVFAILALESEPVDPRL